MKSVQDLVEYETGLTNSRFQNLLVVNGLWMLAFMTLASQPRSSGSVFEMDTIKTILFGIAIAAEITTALCFSALCVGFKVIANIRNPPADQAAKGGKKVNTWEKMFAIAFVRGHIIVTPVLLTAFWAYLSYCSLPAGAIWERAAFYIPLGAAALAFVSFFWRRKWIPYTPAQSPAE